MSTKRIEWIDAMRGFTMLLVVYSHISFFGYSDTFNSAVSNGGGFLSFNAFFVLFRMPLFFFISGFILYKRDVIYNWSKSVSFLKKKMQVQLIPTMFFLIVITFIQDANLWDRLTASLKGGYWFTITLFEYFVIYIAFRFICYKLGKYEGDVVLLVGSILLYFAVSPSCLRLLHLYDTPINGILGLEQLKYFVFFAIGTLVKKYFIKVQELLDNKFITAFGILLLFGVTIYVLHNGYFTIALYNHLFNLISGFLGLMLVFSFFRKYQNTFTQDSKIGRLLQYVGRRTLDVYLLHYFFLPYNLKFIGDFFATNLNPTLEFVVSMILSVIVVSICLLVSSILRLSPFLAHWIFGAKTQPMNIIK